MTQLGVTFYFMRHAETYLNYFERVQGWCDAPLTKQGIADAHRSGLGLKDVTFDAVYTSDLQRTVKTAEIILEHNNHGQGLEIVQMPELREVFFGYFEGHDAPLFIQDIQSKVELKHNLPAGSQEQIEWFMNKTKNLDPSSMAENYFEFWHRVESGLLKLLNKHAGTNQNILVVSHGLTIRNLLHALLEDFEIGEPLDNASVCIVDYHSGAFHLQAYNQTNHFTEEDK